MSTSLRFAMRSLGRTLGFTVPVVLCLALGIGVNVAFLGVLDVLLLRPPAGVRAPESLYRVAAMPVHSPNQRVTFGMQLSRGDLARLAARRETFERISGFARAYDLSLGTGRDAREVRASFVDAAYFGVVGVPAARGRLIGAADTVPGAPGVVVLGERLWRAAYGGDPGVVGRRVRINGDEFTVVGVAGGGFTGTTVDATDLWMPTSAFAIVGFGNDFVNDPDSRWLDVVARLAPGVSPSRAAAVAGTVLAASPMPRHSSLGSPKAAEVKPVTSRFGGAMQSEEPPVPVWLLGATAALLLVACANVANLLLARGEWRRRELATRVALGATRGALVRQLLVESAVLAAVGSVLGLLLAQLGMRAFAQLPNMPLLDRVIDWRLAGATLLVAALTTLLCGLVPALRGTRVDAPAALKAGGRVTAGRSRLRSLLMVGQLATALALLVAGGVFLRSLQALRSIDTGIDVEHAVVMTVNLERAGMKPADRAAFAERAVQRVAALPQVAGVARTMTETFGGMVFNKITVDGVELPSAGPPGFQIANIVSPGYFAAARLAMRAGRGFTEADAAGSEEVAVVSEAFARAAWKGADAVGKCLRENDTPCVRVVGVAANVPFLGLRDSAPMLVYRPMPLRDPASELTLYVRSAGSPAATARAVRAAVQGMDERLPYVSAYPLMEGQRMRTELAPFRLAGAAFSVFGGLALLVAAIGLYAVVAYSVARRTNEIGVRVALGATARSIRHLVLGQGARHALAGTAIGLALGAAATHALRAKLYGVKPLDVPTFAVVTLVLLAVALLASWLPARRAASIPPTEALRSE